MEQMISMTRNRPRYNEQMFLNPPPPYSIGYQPGPFPYSTNQDDYEAERYRNKILERQVQDMARDHAREKQGLVSKLEELRYAAYRMHLKP